ncbi:MAG: chorismate synthase [Cellulosilyticaceae bacterium]
MSGSLFGKNFTISTFGESHGPAIGVIVDGCPSNIPLTLEDIMKYMDRRKPGNAAIATARSESDTVEILSGVFEGRTTGTPIALLIRNQDQRSHNYDHIKDIYRPSHGDYPYDMKYGHRDYRGGGRSSARETAARVAGGAIALRFLDELGIHVSAYTKSIGPICVADEEYDFEECQNNLLTMPHKEKAQAAFDYIQQIKADKDSIGGAVECVVTGVPAGIGEPMFDKLDALLGQAMMSINAVKAFEVGLGIGCTSLPGSQYNDAFYKDQSGTVTKKTNHSGGILAGLSDGDPIVLRTHFKPTPSIASQQETLDRSTNATTISIHGRHDPCVVPRGVVVVEAMAALVVADLILAATCSRVERIKLALNLGK